MFCYGFYNFCKRKQYITKTKRYENKFIFQGTVNAVINLVNKDFDSLFKNYSSEEVVLDLFDEIEAFVDYAASQKHLLGVILGQKALKVLGSSEFIQADIERQFTEEDDDDELFSGLPLDCAMCDGIHCYRHCADVSYLNAGGYGSFWECPRGHLKDSLSLLESELQMDAAEEYMFR